MWDEVREDQYSRKTLTADIVTLDTHGQTNTSEATIQQRLCMQNPSSVKNVFEQLKFYVEKEENWRYILKTCLNNIQWAMFWRMGAFSRQEMEFLPLVQHG